MSLCVFWNVIWFWTNPLTSFDILQVSIAHFHIVNVGKSKYLDTWLDPSLSWTVGPCIQTNFKNCEQMQWLPLLEEDCFTSTCTHSEPIVFLLQNSGVFSFSLLLLEVCMGGFDWIRVPKTCDVWALILHIHLLIDESVEQKIQLHLCMVFEMWPCNLKFFE